MKTIIKTTLAAFALIAGVNASQAQPGALVWHFPYKAAPYATRTEPVQQVAPVQAVRHGKHVHVKMANKKQVVR